MDDSDPTAEQTSVLSMINAHERDTARAPWETLTCAHTLSQIQRSHPSTAVELSSPDLRPLEKEFIHFMQLK